MTKNNEQRRKWSVVLAALLGLGTISSTAHAGLVGFWKFDEGSGTVAHDISGNGNNGTLTAVGGGIAPAWTTGHDGTGHALDFYQNSQYGQGNVTVPDAASLHISTSFTLAAWVYDTGSDYGDIFVAGVNRYSRNWLLQVSKNGTDSNYFWSDTNPGLQTSLGYITPTNGWHHLAVTYDGANLRTYGDGVFKTAVPMSPITAWGILRLGGGSNFGSGLWGET